MHRSLAVFLALLLGACGLLPEVKDETAGLSAEKLYAEAKDEIAQGGYTRAIKFLEKLEARYPYGRYAQQAQIELAYVHFKDGDQTSAIAAADRFIKLHPNHPNVDYVYYLKGLVNFNEDRGLLGRFGKQDLTERDPKAARDSFDAFKQLVTRYPDSKYTPDAIARMKYLVNALASHEVHVAHYYMKRGAYVAAANRAQYALLNYPQAPAVEEALFVMVKAYDAMGMTDLRDDADRVMHKNFPDSPYLKGTAGKKDPWWMLWGNAW
ncbi:MAG: outer membrane protein assembly factor BamD [Betaproteobacteria bacterium RIFCSPLOWO2_12_FULL_64_23]|nr:MAG: outer membrane protein assembly factor BamD [Betaproteobacteria bacterium RIFCSPLOWO2_12_FULL_64_23]